MTEVFRASNGLPVRLDGEGVVRVGHGDDVFGFPLIDRTNALREYFQHERDEDLGRWRDPRYPGIFAAGIGNDPDVVQIVKEKGGTAYAQYRRSELTMGPGIDPMSIVARAYFDAHPVEDEEPKPWLDAKPGEVWVLTIDGNESAAVIRPKGLIVGTTWSIVGDSDLITAGKRIWPEGDSDD